MNASEGLSRAATIVRGLGWLSVAAWACFAAFLIYAEGNPVQSIALCTIIGGLFLATAYAVAYVIDGFAKPK